MIKLIIISVLSATLTSSLCVSFALHQAWQEAIEYGNEGWDEALDGWTESLKNLEDLEECYVQIGWME